MKRTYVEWNPHGKTRRLIELAEAICVDYADQGYDLTAAPRSTARCFAR